MRYVIKTMSKQVYYITAEEFAQLAGKSGMVYFRSLDTMVNLNSCETIGNEEQFEAANKDNQKAGVLHDGTRVIKIMGQWRSAHNPECNFDPAYYPEIAKDQVMSEAEYIRLKNNNKQLPEITPTRRTSQGLTKI